LYKLGKLLHISSSGNLILRAEVTPPLGVLVLTEDAREVGRVSDVFGPKNAPYVSVRSPSVASVLRSLVGRVLFYEERRGERGGREVEPIPIRRKRGG
jgi:rRNA processing protein Gar1